VDYGRASDRVFVLDTDGETIVDVFHNHRKEVTINMTPIGTSIAAAYTSMNLLDVAPGTTVTLTDASASIGATHTGAYEVISTRQTRTNNDRVRVQMDLVQFTVNNLAAVIT
jgi:hypothetical protein